MHTTIKFKVKNCIKAPYDGKYVTFDNMRVPNINEHITIGNSYCRVVDVITEIINFHTCNYTIVIEKEFKPYYFSKEDN